MNSFCPSPGFKDQRARLDPGKKAFLELPPLPRAFSRGSLPVSKPVSPTYKLCGFGQVTSDLWACFLICKLGMTTLITQVSNITLSMRRKRQGLGPASAQHTASSQALFPDSGPGGPTSGWACVCCSAQHPAQSLAPHHSPLGASVPSYVEVQVPGRSASPDSLDHTAHPPQATSQGQGVL